MPYCLPGDAIFGNFYRWFWSNPTLTNPDVSRKPTAAGRTNAMPQTDYDAAIAEFLRKRAVTRCPTACAVQTRASVPEADRVALRSYSAAKEVARLEKIRVFQFA
jgi:hypothetical protein